MSRTHYPHPPLTLDLRKAWGSTTLLLLGGSLVAGSLAATGNDALALLTAIVPITVVIALLGGTGALLAIMIGALLIGGLFLPDYARALPEFLVVAMALSFTLSLILRERWMRLARVSFLLLCLLFLVAVFNPNVPEISLGLRGVRASIVTLAGLMLGLAVGNPLLSKHWSLSKAMLATLMLSGVIALTIFLFFPSIEKGFSRSADIYTALLGGQARMQGHLSGPFHVSMLGAFLSLLGFWGLIVRKAFSAPLFLVGLPLLLLANVRTGIFAFIVGTTILLAHLAFGKTIRRGESFTFRPLPPRGILFGFFGLLGLTTVAFLFSDVPAIDSFAELGSDSRSQNRLKTIGIALALIESSPLFGWGAGSATSMLAVDFAAYGRNHVTPHSGALELAVQTGLIGLLAFLVILIAIGNQTWNSLRRSRKQWEDGLIISAVSVIFIFWIFGDAFSAIPVSLGISLLLGSALRETFKAQAMVSPQTTAR